MHTTSEYEPVPPVYDSLIKQQTSQSVWVFSVDGADVRNHPGAAAAAAAETLHVKTYIDTSRGHSGGARRFSLSL